MEDKNNVLTFIKVIKWVIIVVFILLILGFVVWKVIDNYNKERFDDYFKGAGFSLNEGVWVKEDKEEVEDGIYNITYTYRPDINNYVKEIKNNMSDYQEFISFKYNGTDDISIGYSYNDVSKNCTVTHDASYDYVNNDFSCETTDNYNNCPLRCNVIKQEAKNFSNELKTILDNAKVNKSFLIKNKD